jgi:hypothetical protein
MDGFLRPETTKSKANKLQNVSKNLLGFSKVRANINALKIIKLYTIIASISQIVELISKRL